MKQPEDWLPHEREEFIEDGRGAGIVWAKEELEKNANDFIQGNLKWLKPLLNSISDEEPEIDGSESEQSGYFSWGYGTGQQEAKRYLTELLEYPIKKASVEQRILKLAEVFETLDEISEGNFPWGDEDSEYPSGQIFLPGESQDHPLPVLDEQLVPLYRQNKPSQMKFWDIQGQIALVLAESQRDDSVEVIGGRLIERGLRNEHNYLVLFTQKVPDSAPFDVLKSMSLALPG